MPVVSARWLPADSRQVTIREVSTLYSLASTTKVMVKWHAGEQAVLGP
jgi:hypothetical protein